MLRLSFKRPYWQSLITGLILLIPVACGPEAATERPEAATISSGTETSSRTPAPVDETEPVETIRPEDIPSFLKNIKDDVLVGVLLPFTGPSGGTGQALMDAATLALFESYDPRISLVSFDTRGNPEGAIQAAEKAISQGVDVVLGPLFSSSITAVTPLFNERNIPLIGFSNNKDVANIGVYLLSFFVEQEVERIVEYAKSQNLDRFAALVPETDYGNRVLLNFAEAVTDKGGRFTAIESYTSDANSIFDPIRRLANYDKRSQAYQNEVRFLQSLNDDLADEILEQLESMETLGALNYDAVLIAEGGELLRSVASVLPFYEVDPSEIQFLGTGLWDDPSLTREPTLIGGWFAGAEPEKPRAFLQRFESMFGYSPPRITTLAYDALALVAHLARNPIADEKFLPKAFLNPKGFVGLDGAFRFNAEGIVERNLAVLEIQKNGFKVISPARLHFNDSSAYIGRISATR